MNRVVGLLTKMQGLIGEPVQDFRTRLAPVASIPLPRALEVGLTPNAPQLKCDGCSLGDQVDWRKTKSITDAVPVGRD